MVGRLVRGGAPERGEAHRVRVPGGRIRRLPAGRSGDVQAPRAAHNTAGNTLATHCSPTPFPPRCVHRRCFATHTALPRVVTPLKPTRPPTRPSTSAQGDYTVSKVFGEALGKYPQCRVVSSPRVLVAIQECNLPGQLIEDRETSFAMSYPGLSFKTNPKGWTTVRRILLRAPA